MRSVIILLGTGNPNPYPERFGPAVAIMVNDSLYLIDCGAGVARRVAAAGIPVSKITRVFLTHLHSDHTIGYRCPKLVQSWTSHARIDVQFLVHRGCITGT